MSLSLALPPSELATALGLIVIRRIEFESAERLQNSLLFASADLSRSVRDYSRLFLRERRWRSSWSFVLSFHL